MATMFFPLPNVDGPPKFSVLAGSYNFNHCINHYSVSLHLHWELELVVHFGHQKIMAQSLPHLHDPHNSSINLILTVLKDPLCGAGLLLHLEQIERFKKKKKITNNSQIQGGKESSNQYKPSLSSGSGLFWSWRACVWSHCCTKTCLRPPRLCFLGFWWARGLFHRRATAECGAAHCPLQSDKTTQSLDQWCCIMSTWQGLLLA